MIQQLQPWVVGLRTIAAALIFAYCMLIAYVYLRQDALLYLPQRLSPGEAAELARAGELVPWTGGTLRGYLRRPTAERVRGTVVVFHGNAGTALDRSYYADALTPLGFRVILAEYPGYGEKPGAPGEASLAADAVATLNAARQAFPGPLFAWGESLGAGVVGSAIADRPGLVDGLVLLTPWDSLTDIASHHYGYLPVRWMLRDRYDNVANLKRFPGPTVVLVAARDRTIPPAHGQRLHAALDGRKRLRTFADADHNTWPAEPSAPWWGEVMRELVAG